MLVPYDQTIHPQHSMKYILDYWLADTDKCIFIMKKTANLLMSLYVEVSVLNLILHNRLKTCLKLK